MEVAMQDTALTMEEKEAMFEAKVGYNYIYREDSTLYMKGEYIRGNDGVLVKNGEFIYFYISGGVRDRGRYNETFRVGKWLHFDEEAHLIFEQDFTSLHRTYYYKNGKMRAGGMMVRKEMDTRRLFDFFNLTDHAGPWKFYGGDEKCACKGMIAGDAKIGKWIYYSADRKNKINRNYSKKIKRGNYRFLDSCLWR